MPEWLCSSQTIEIKPCYKIVFAAGGKQQWIRVKEKIQHTFVKSIGKDGSKVMWNVERLDWAKSSPQKLILFVSVKLFRKDFPM